MTGDQAEILSDGANNGHFNLFDSVQHGLDEENGQNMVNRETFESSSHPDKSICIAGGNKGQFTKSNKGQFTKIALQSTISLSHASNYEQDLQRKVMILDRWQRVLVSLNQSYKKAFEQGASSRYLMLKHMETFSSASIRP